MTRSCVMPLAAWVLLATFTWCSYAHAAPVPPVAAALSSTSQDLPGSQAWVGGAGDLYPISQEGSKRGYSDRNYLRFGREGNSFLRFGRSVNHQLNSLYCDDCDEPKPPGINFTPSPTPVQPMTRAKQDISAHSIESSEPEESSSQRTKRAAAPTFNDYGSIQSYSPISWARGFQPEEEIITVSSDDPQDVNKRANDRNFLRFGRAVDHQLNLLSCDGCDVPKTLRTNSISSPTPIQPTTRSKQDISAHSIESKPWENSSQRTKRASAPTFYDYGSIQSYSPISWARGFQPEEEIITVSSEDPQDVNKRANDRNFLRFGRDRNFLRFGKRDRSNEYPPSSSESSGSLVLARPAEYSRNLRAPQRTFLRFG